MGFRFPYVASQRRIGCLALRIGSEEIDFLFFEKTPEGVRIISYGTEDVAHFNTRQTLEKIFVQLSLKKSIQELIATFDASSFRAQVIQQTISPILPSRFIDSALAFSVEQDIRARASRVFQKILFQESGILPGEFSLRNIRILERRIDGYPVPRLAGFKGGEIEFSILGMFLLEAPFLPLEQFAKSHSIRNIRVIHIAEALEFFAKEHSQEGVYLCVEEEKTQIAIQKEGRFLFLGSIPMGSDNFTKSFGDLLGMREAVAEAFQEQYFQGSLSQAVREKVRSYLLPESRNFATLVKKKLSSANMVLPGSIWIFGKGRGLRDVQEVFHDDGLEDLPFSQKPDVHFLFPKEVWNVKEFPGGNDPVYTTLCLLAARTES